MSHEQGKKPLNVSVNLKVDVPGLKPVSDAVGSVTEKTAAGAMGFLSSICGRASTQIGALFEDKVRYWRYLNLLKFTEKTEKLHKKLGIEKSHEIHPRMLVEIVEGVAKQEDDELLDWWAGLTVSSCEENPTDRDLIFTGLMGKITCLQKNILTFACKSATVVHSSRGLIIAEKLTTTDEEIFKISGTHNINIIDRELDSLRSNGLLTSGSGFNFSSDIDEIIITPSTLALHFFARCNGRRDDFKKFYESKAVSLCPDCNGYHPSYPCIEAHRKQMEKSIQDMKKISTTRHSDFMKKLNH